MYAVAHSESARVSEEQNLLRKIESENTITNNVINNNISVELERSIDDLWYTQTLSTKTSNLYHSTQHIYKKVNFMFSSSYPTGNFLFE